MAECELRIELLSAFRANPMGKFSFRAITDINFDLVPVSFGVAYLFAGNTDLNEDHQILWERATPTVPDCSPYHFEYNH